MHNLNQSELSNVASVLSQPAENFGNDPLIEYSWAIKAYEHAETYFNILLAINPEDLRLCPLDSEIHEKFRESFPQLKVQLLIEDELKNDENKILWRDYCNKFEGRVLDWNMATLLRLDASKDICEENTTIVPRIQFMAIEIARNREGVNNKLKEVYKKS